MGRDRPAYSGPNPIYYFLSGMTTTQFTGVITALLTPFSGGKVSWPDLEGFVEGQIKAGIQGLVAVGTTGESPTLDTNEHIDVIRTVVKQAAGRVPVLAGTGSNSTAEAVSLTRAADQAGADGFLVVAPYYNKPGPEGLYHYFASIAEVTEKPIVLYSIPSRCGIEIDVPTICRLRENFPHVNHLKEAGGSCARVDQVREALGEDLVILSGDDALTLPFLSLGAEGVISVASNILIEPLVDLVHAARENDFARALTLHQRYLTLFQHLFLESNPVPVKYAAQKMGLISSSEVRSPLAPLQPSTIERLEAVLRQTGLLTS